MKRVRIYETGEEIRVLFRALWQLGKFSPLQLEIGTWESMAPCDCLLLGPDALMHTAPACRLLLLPGQAAHVAGTAKAAGVVSYGLSPRDSLSLSGTRGGHYAFSVQRELFTVTGGVVERQELILPRRSPSAMVQMAATLLLLALDVPPEGLAPLFHRNGASIPLRGRGDSAIL